MTEGEDFAGIGQKSGTKEQGWNLEVSCRGRPPSPALLNTEGKRCRVWLEVRRDGISWHSMS